MYYKNDVKLSSDIPPTNYRNPVKPIISFEKIRVLIQNQPSKELEFNLNNLRNQTQNKNFPFQDDFVTLELSQLFISSLLVPSSKYLQITLFIIDNFCNLNTELYIQNMLNSGLVPALDQLLSKINTTDIFLPTISIFQKIVCHSCEYRNLFYQSLDCTKFLNFALECSSDETIAGEICNFFRASLKYPITNEFDYFFPLFEKLYLKYHKTEAINKLLLLYINLARIPSFSEYYKDNVNDENESIVNQIIDLSYEKGDEIVKLSLTFAYIMIQMYYPISISNVNRFIQLLGSGFGGVSYRASLIMNYIIIEESALIQVSQYTTLCERLLKGIQDGELKKIVSFLEAFHTFLTHLINKDSFEICLQYGAGSILTVFLDCESDEIFFWVVDSILILANIEMKEKNEKTLLLDFLENGGMENIQTYLAEGSDEQVLALIKQLSTIFKIDF